MWDTTNDILMDDYDIWEKEKEAEDDDAWKDPRIKQRDLWYSQATSNDNWLDPDYGGDLYDPLF